MERYPQPGRDGRLSPARRAARGLALAGVAGVAAYALLLRPRLLRWGASDDEVTRPLPGHALVRQPDYLTTRAVTVHATPDEIWPWLVQMGYRRGGLYSYDWPDRLFGYLNRPSATEILPEFQHLTVGGTIPVGRGPNWPVRVVEPPHALVLDPVAGAITWAIRPRGARRTLDPAHHPRPLPRGAHGVRPAPQRADRSRGVRDDAQDAAHPQAAGRAHLGTVERIRGAGVLETTSPPATKRSTSMSPRPQPGVGDATPVPCPVVRGSVYAVARRGRGSSPTARRTGWS